MSARLQRWGKWKHGFEPVKLLLPFMMPTLEQAGEKRQANGEKRSQSNSYLKKVGK